MPPAPPVPTSMQSTDVALLFSTQDQTGGGRQIQNLAKATITGSLKGQIDFQLPNSAIELLAILQKSLDRALFLYIFIREVRSSGVRASITIVHIRKFYKMQKKIVRFRLRSHDTGTF